MTLPEQETLRSLVALTSLAFSVLCFLSFLWPGPGLGSKAPQGPTALTQGAGTPVTVADLALLIEAVAKLGDTLIKAGPALWRLLASILFLLIAALSTGVFQGSPPQPSAQVATTAPGGSTATADPALADPTQNLDVNAMRGDLAKADSREGR